MKGFPVCTDKVPRQALPHCVTANTHNGLENIGPTYLLRVQCVFQ